MAFSIGPPKRQAEAIFFSGVELGIIPSSDELLTLLMYFPNPSFELIVSLCGIDADSIELIAFIMTNYSYFFLLS